MSTCIADFLPFFLLGKVLKSPGNVTAISRDGGEIPRKFPLRTPTTRDESAVRAVDTDQNGQTTPVLGRSAAYLQRSQPIRRVCGGCPKQFFYGCSRWYVRVCPSPRPSHHCGTHRPQHEAGRFGRRGVRFSRRCICGWRNAALDCFTCMFVSAVDNILCTSPRAENRRRTAP